jgi:hypothetical protein
MNLLSIREDTEVRSRVGVFATVPSEPACAGTRILMCDG